MEEQVINANQNFGLAGWVLLICLGLVLVRTT